MSSVPRVEKVQIFLKCGRYNFYRGNTCELDKLKVDNDSTQQIFSHVLEKISDTRLPSCCVNFERSSTSVAARFHAEETSGIICQRRSASSKTGVSLCVHDVAQIR